MAKIKSPDMGIVGRLGPVLDFYYWKGIACVRTYPRHIKQPGTPEQKVTWDAMLFAIDEYGAMDGREKKAWKNLCVPPERSGKDYFYRILLSGYNNPKGIFMRPHVELAWIGGNQIRVKIKKKKGWEFRVTLMSEEQRLATVNWEEETHCLRGKKWRRKYKIRDNTERLATQITIPAGQDALIFYIEEKPAYKWMTGKPYPDHGQAYGRIGLFAMSRKEQE